MKMLSRNEEYYDRYTELQDLVLRAYIDVLSLEEITSAVGTNQDSHIEMLDVSINALGHICELLKADMALTIWKIYYESYGWANNIGNLNRDFFAPRGERRETKLPKDLKTYKAPIQTLRKEYLAHNSAEKSGTSISVQALRAVLDAIKDLLNGLCDPTLDSRVEPVTESALYTLDINVKLGLGTVIRK